jgi:hypothetical protein
MLIYLFIDYWHTIHKSLLPPENELTTKITQLKGIHAPNKHNWNYTNHAT